MSDATPYRVRCSICGRRLILGAAFNRIPWLLHSFLVGVRRGRGRMTPQRAAGASPRAALWSIQLELRRRYQQMRRVGIADAEAEIAATRQELP